MVFFRSQNLRSDEPVLTARTKQKVSLPKLKLSDMSCIDCVPKQLHLPVPATFVYLTDEEPVKYNHHSVVELSNEQVEKSEVR